MWWCPVYQGIPLINADSASAETGFLHETEHKGVECIQEIVDGPGVPLGYPLVCLDRITDLYNLIERTLNLSFPEHICNSMGTEVVTLYGDSRIDGTDKDAFLRTDEKTVPSRCLQLSIKVDRLDNRSSIPESKRILAISPTSMNTFLFLHT